MTEADARRLSRSLKDAATVVVLTRDGSTYAGSPVTLRMDTACGRLVGEVVMRLSHGTTELVDFGEIVQVRDGDLEQQEQL